MNDFELNKAIAELTHPNLDWFMDSTCYDNTTVAANSGDGWTLNYCANWNDLMPLVIEHRIETEDLDTMWVAIGLRADGSLLSVTNTDLQRAYAECLYKVLKNKE